MHLILFALNLLHISSEIMYIRGFQTHVCVQRKAAVRSTFLRVYRSAMPSSDISLVLNHVCHRFCPKLFFELLSFEHTLCHCDNTSNCTLRQSNALRGAFDAGFHKKNASKFFEMESTPLIHRNAGFVLQLCLYECLKALKIFKSLSFASHHVNPYLPREIIHKSKKILCPSYGHGPHGAVNTQVRAQSPTVLSLAFSNCRPAFLTVVCLWVGLCYLRHQLLGSHFALLCF